MYFLTSFKSSCDKEAGDKYFEYMHPSGKKFRSLKAAKAAGFVKA